MPDPIISEARLEKALTFLAESDRTYAGYKAELARAEILCKRVRAREFLVADGNNEERKAKVEVAADVGQMDELYLTCLTNFETLRAQRQRAEIVIDVWRSLEASRRKA